MAQMKEFCAGIKVGARQTHRNMTLYCLLSADDAPVDFLTLDVALANGAPTVTEVFDGGSVPELKISNRSDQKILLVDGEELVGAKQTRVLNTTILIAPKSETIIPVSCVEQGRWSYRGKHFGSQSRSMSANLRKRKAETMTRNLRERMDFLSNQGVVWDEIEKAIGSAKSSVHTGDTTASMLGHFLTWMQESKADFIIAATANDIHSLPAEFIRRFDQIFFLDVPTTEERWEIYQIMMKPLHK